MESAIEHRDVIGDGRYNQLFSEAEVIAEELPLSAFPIQADAQVQIGKYLPEWVKLRGKLEEIKQVMQQNQLSESYKQRFQVLEARYDDWSAYIIKLQNVVNSKNQ